MISYWERESLLKYDIIVVGSGIVGLQTAILAKEKFPNRNVAVLERGILPTGASTRNAGFAATGSLSELIMDSQRMSEEEIFALFAARKSGLDFLKKKFGKTAIGYENNGSHELLKEEESPILEHIDHFNALLKELNNKQPIFREEHEKIHEFGWKNSLFSYCLSNSTEGSIDTGKLIKTLMQKALENRIQIITGAELISYDNSCTKVELKVKDYFRGENLALYAEKVVFCTNAFTPTFFPNEDIQVGRGQILITKPIENLKFRGLFYFGQGYYYLRTVGNRVLFGGGRNADFEGETTSKMELNPTILEHLENFLKEQILPDQQFEIDMKWSGIMAFGQSKSPIIKVVNDRILGGFRLGGMGVALGSSVAQQLVEKIE